MIAQYKWIYDFLSQQVLGHLSETHSYKDDDAGHPAWSGDICKCWVKKPRAMGFMEHKDLLYLFGDTWRVPTGYHGKKRKTKVGHSEFLKCPPLPPPKQRRENMVPRF